MSLILPTSPPLFLFIFWLVSLVCRGPLCTHFQQTNFLHTYLVLMSPPLSRPPLLWVNFSLLLVSTTLDFSTHHRYCHLVCSSIDPTRADALCEGPKGRGECAWNTRAGKSK
jgi:hypothetical protein